MTENKIIQKNGLPIDATERSVKNPDGKMIINRDYIGVIEEVDGRLNYVKIPTGVDYSLISDLRALINDENATVIDMQKRFDRSFPQEQFKSVEYNYVFPHQYRDAYIGVTTYPYFYTNPNEYDSDTQKACEKIQMKICKRLTDGRCETVNLYSEDEIKQYIRLYHQYRKCSFGEGWLEYGYNEIVNRIQFYQNRICYPYERFIYAFYFRQKIQELEQLPAIKMFSTDAIGWKTYPYEINDDIKITVESNFAYGSAAYFFCNLAYKGINILPYSAVVNYYKVKWSQFTRYTRKYEPSCDNWENVLCFVADVANLAKHNVDEFIKKWIYEELRTMIEGLHNLIDNPETDPGIIQIRRLIKSDDNGHRSNTGYFRMVIDCDGSDVREYEALPDEKIVAYKAEKISGCINLLRNLKKLKNVYEYAGYCIDEIKKMNLQIVPEINQCLRTLVIRREKFVNKYNEVKPQLDDVRKQYERCCVKYRHEISEIARSLAKGTGHSISHFKDEAEDTFALTNSEFRQLRERKRDLQKQVSELEKRIYFIDNFRKSLNDRLRIIKLNFS